jgi:AcrR family transcriptional regulator
VATTNGPTRRRPGRPPKSEARDTKAALVEAALRLFAQKGYAGTSIRAIAREVGLSESVLYAHFPSKRAIFGAAMKRLRPEGVSTALARIDPALADCDPPGFVRELIRCVMAEWESRDAGLLASLMVRDGLAHHPATTASMDELVERLATFFGGWIAAGQAPADLGAPTDLAYALLSPIGMAWLFRLHADATPEQRALARERAARHTELFIRAVFRCPDPYRPEAHGLTTPDTTDVAAELP